MGELVTLAAALAASFALIGRLAVHRFGWGLTAAAIALGLGLFVVGLVGTVLGLAGVFRAGVLASCFAAVTGLGVIGSWFARRRLGQPPSQSLRGPMTWSSLAIMVVIGLGVWLRLPPADVVFAGKDHGTYVLRAHQLARTGAMTQSMPLLAQACSPQHGQEDLCGLYRRVHAEHLRGVYEASYRPGWYVSDLEQGKVVPQFLHLFPALLGVGVLVDPTVGARGVVCVVALVAMLAFAALACTLWPRGPWALVAMTVFALAPTVVWTHRHPLTEGLTGVLLCCAALLFVRARAGNGKTLDLVVGALCLGATAWVRGNAWLAAPVVFAVAWFRPRTPQHHLAVAIFAGMLTTSVVVHAYSVFPYLHDELLRHVAALQVGPDLIVASMLAALALWVVIDVAAASRMPQRWRARAVPGMRWLLLGLIALAAALYLSSGGPAGPPFARLTLLEAGLGPGLTLFAALGGALWWWRWRAATDDTWVVAMLIASVVSVVVLARHNSPHLYLFYYGRYFVPEILPIAILAAVWLPAAWAQSNWIAARSWRKRLPPALAVWVVGEVAMPWIRSPSMGMAEHTGGREFVSWLADRIEPNAIVLAGGEGSHAQHVFNQVGGALEMMHGVTVVPYHSREAAHATISSLLLAAGGGVDDHVRPTYLLIDEASRPRASEDGRRVAVIDDVLLPPFRAGDINTGELHTNALVARRDGFPSRSTRHELRLALVRVLPDADAVAARESIDLFAQKRGDAGDRPAEARCYDDDGRIELEVPNGPPGPWAITLLALPGAGETNARLQVDVDGERVLLSGPGQTPRARRMLGPIEWPTRPKQIRLRSRTQISTAGPCRFGALADVWLSPLRYVPGQISDSVVVGGDELGGVDWVAGRALTASRPLRVPGRPQRNRGETGAAELRKVRRTASDLPFLTVTDSSPVEFGHVRLPAHRGQAVDWVVSLRGARNPAGAKMELVVGDVVVGTFDPPRRAARLWSAPAMRSSVSADLVVSVSVRWAGEPGNDASAEIQAVAVTPAFSVRGETAAERSH